MAVFQRRLRNEQYHRSRHPEKHDMQVTRSLALLTAATLLGCSSADDGSAAQSNTPQAAQPFSLFSDSVHDLAMPAPGRARLEFRGQILEAAMFSDCSASLEPPTADQTWEAHGFAAWPRFEMEQGSASLQFQRSILPHEESWSAAAHEQEVITLTLPEGDEMWTYTLHRLTPSDPAMIARPMDQPPQRAGADDLLPGIRVHPDGHQAMFIGRLGQTSMLETLSDPRMEEVRIAVHCGPV